MTNSYYGDEILIYLSPWGKLVEDILLDYISIMWLHYGIYCKCTHSEICVYKDKQLFNQTQQHCIGYTTGVNYTIIIRINISIYRFR